MPENQDAGGGPIRRLWRAFWRPSARWSVAALLIVGGAGGVVAWGGFNTFMEHTNTLEFCISCHEMESTVYEEYKTSVHYTNASGVRAVCSDCHVPKDWTREAHPQDPGDQRALPSLRSARSTRRRSSLRQRLRLAEHVWATMKANDSHECRNCHSFEAMDFHKQTARAAEKMQEAMPAGQTCIDCHKGIAHKLPPSDD